MEELWHLNHGATDLHPIFQSDLWAGEITVKAVPCKTVCLGDAQKSDEVLTLTW